ncbi:DBF4B protein, partial [Chloroceryle aenea]|nr:DBF4B protein [Chloroceryle aenea]
VTESFLSKEVSCVVSSNKEARRDKGRTWAEKRSNVTSDGKATSLVASASRGNHARPHQKPPDTALISRGRELLQKAMKNQVSREWMSFSLAGILANARLWGVRIVHVDGILLWRLRVRCWELGTVFFETRGAEGMWVRLEERAGAGGIGLSGGQGKLKPPFLKVEDQSRQFRPFHQQFKSFPTLNFLAPKSSSPFEPLKSLSNSCRASDGEKSPRSTPVMAPKKKRGFCECCQETFEELQKHLQSPQHKRFALDDSQYAPVDRVISQLSHSF